MRQPMRWTGSGSSKLGVWDLKCSHCGNAGWASFRLENWDGKQIWKNWDLSSSLGHDELSVGGANIHCRCGERLLRPND